MKATQTKVPLGDDKFALYINMLDFKYEDEWNATYKRIQQLIKESKGRTRVF